jgi:Domain of unknown function (DUF5664)
MGDVQGWAAKGPDDRREHDRPATIVTRRETTPPVQDRNEVLAAGGHKDAITDPKKARPGLMPHYALIELAELYGLGAAKYEARNWEKGISFTVLTDALERHYRAWATGEIHDPKDGQHHLIAVAWNALTLFELERRGMTEFDDIPERSHLHAEG